MLFPSEHLNKLTKSLPNAWKSVDLFRQSNGVDLPEWPQWCFLPMAAWYAIASGGKQLGLDDIYKVSYCAAMGTWRYSQGIYQFAPTVYKTLLDSELKGDLPADVFYRLPEWSVYIETPDSKWLDTPLYGFWAHLEFDVNTKRTELRLLLNTSELLVPIPIHLGSWSLQEAIDRAGAEAAKQGRIAGINPTLTGFEKRVTEQLQGYISLVLYLCQNEPEIDDARQPGTSPTRPEAKRTKHGYRLFPADKPRVWSVGLETERTLKQADLYESDGRTVRPHIRRGHWHGFWKGPRNAERTFLYKWLPPMVVGSAESKL